jgi:hypothetical protein
MNLQLQSLFYTSKILCVLTAINISTLKTQDACLSETSEKFFLMHRVILLRRKLKLATNYIKDTVLQCIRKT